MSESDLGQTVSIPDADLQLSRLGFGCSSLMRVTSNQERQRLLAAAVEQGISHFDCARMYGLGEAEKVLGEFARGRRSDITIATKFGIEPAPGLGRVARFQRPARAVLNRAPALRQLVKRRGDALNAPRRYDAASAKASLDQSLRALGTDYVDILFIHDPRPYDEVRVPELLDFFRHALAAGKIRAWGVSQEADVEGIASALGTPSVLQVRRDVFAESERVRPHVVFGVLGGAYARITRVLAGDAAKRRRWTEILGFDPCGGDSLGALLLQEAITRDPSVAALFSTTRNEGIRTAGRVLDAPVSLDIVKAFRSLVGAELQSATSAPSQR